MRIDQGTPHGLITDGFPLQKTFFPNKSQIFSIVDFPIACHNKALWNPKAPAIGRRRYIPGGF